jgi:transcriptional regulatory protein LevR
MANKDLQPYNGHPFDLKCVKVLNEIIEKTNPIIIISSDWKAHFTVSQLSQIFVENGVNAVVDSVTGSSWGVMFISLKQLEECRAYEINKYVKEHEITKWVAIDDLDLKPWIPDNFVRCTHSTEGLKQSGIKDKILNILI